MITAYYVKTDGTGKHAADLIVGVVSLRHEVNGTGWRFTPWNQSAPSRRLWSTPDAALRGRVTSYKLEPRSVE